MELPTLGALDTTRLRRHKPDAPTPEPEPEPEPTAGALRGRYFRNTPNHYFLETVLRPRAQNERETRRAEQAGRDAAALFMDRRRYPDPPAFPPWPPWDDEQWASASAALVETARAQVRAYGAACDAYLARLHLATVSNAQGEPEERIDIFQAFDERALKGDIRDANQAVRALSEAVRRSRMPATRQNALASAAVAEADRDLQALVAAARREYEVGEQLAQRVATLVAQSRLHRAAQAHDAAVRREELRTIPRARAARVNKRNAGIDNTRTMSAKTEGEKVQADRQAWKLQTKRKGTLRPGYETPLPVFFVDRGLRPPEYAFGVDVLDAATIDSLDRIVALQHRSAVAAETPPWTLRDLIRMLMEAYAALLIVGEPIEVEARASRGLVGADDGPAYDPATAPPSPRARYFGPQRYVDVSNRNPQALIAQARAARAEAEAAAPAAPAAPASPRSQKVYGGPKPTFLNRGPRPFKPSAGPTGPARGAGAASALRAAARAQRQQAAASAAPIDQATRRAQLVLFETRAARDSAAFDESARALVNVDVRRNELQMLLAQLEATLPEPGVVFRAQGAMEAHKAGVAADKADALAELEQFNSRRGQLHAALLRAGKQLVDSRLRLLRMQTLDAAIALDSRDDTAQGNAKRRATDKAVTDAFASEWRVVKSAEPVVDVVKYAPDGTPLAYSKPYFEIGVVWDPDVRNPRDAAGEPTPPGAYTWKHEPVDRAVLLSNIDTQLRKLRNMLDVRNAEVQARVHKGAAMQAGSDELRLNALAIQKLRSGYYLSYTMDDDGNRIPDPKSRYVKGVYELEREIGEKETDRAAFASTQELYTRLLAIVSAPSTASEVRMGPLYHAWRVLATFTRKGDVSKDEAVARALARSWEKQRRDADRATERRGGSASEKAKAAKANAKALSAASVRANKARADALEVVDRAGALDAFRERTIWGQPRSGQTLEEARRGEGLPPALRERLEPYRRAMNLARAERVYKNDLLFTSDKRPTAPSADPELNARRFAVALERATRRLIGPQAPVGLEAMSDDEKFTLVAQAVLAGVEAITIPNDFERELGGAGGVLAETPSLFEAIAYNLYHADRQHPSERLAALETLVEGFVDHRLRLGVRVRADGDALELAREVAAVENDWSLGARLERQRSAAAQRASEEAAARGATAAEAAEAGAQAAAEYAWPALTGLFAPFDVQMPAEEEARRRYIDVYSWDLSELFDEDAFAFLKTAGIVRTWEHEYLIQLRLGQTDVQSTAVSEGAVALRQQHERARALLAGRHVFASYALRADDYRLVYGAYTADDAFRALWVRRQALAVLPPPALPPTAPEEQTQRDEYLWKHRHADSAWYRHLVRLKDKVEEELAAAKVKEAIQRKRDKGDPAAAPVSLREEIVARLKGRSLKAKFAEAQEKRQEVRCKKVVKLMLTRAWNGQPLQLDQLTAECRRYLESVQWELPDYAHRLRQTEKGRATLQRYRLLQAAIKAERENEERRQDCLRVLRAFVELGVDGARLRSAGQAAQEAALADTGEGNLVDQLPADCAQLLQDAQFDNREELLAALERLMEQSLARQNAAAAAEVNIDVGLQAVEAAEEIGDAEEVEEAVEELDELEPVPEAAMMSRIDEILLNVELTRREAGRGQAWWEAENERSQEAEALLGQREWEFQEAIKALDEVQKEQRWVLLNEYVPMRLAHRDEDRENARWGVSYRPERAEQRRSEEAWLSKVEARLQALKARVSKLKERIDLLRMRPEELRRFGFRGAEEEPLMGGPSWRTPTEAEREAAVAAREGEARDAFEANRRAEEMDET